MGGQVGKEKGRNWDGKIKRTLKVVGLISELTLSWGHECISKY